MAIVLERREREADRQTSLVFLGIEVADGVALFHPAHSTRGTGSEQQRFGQGRLAGTLMADERHVADLGGRERLHEQYPRSYQWPDDSVRMIMTCDYTGQGPGTLDGGYFR